jgi:hypothetical protein
MSFGRRDHAVGPAGDPRHAAFVRICAAAAGVGRHAVPERPRCPGAASAPPAGRGPWRPCARGETSRGAVTAEFAVALPAVVLLLALLLAGSAAGVTQLRLEEAARAGARALARGEDAAAVNAIVRRLAGDAAASTVASDGEWLSVTVSGRVAGAVGSLLPWTLSAKAWARGEASETSALAPARKLQQPQPLRQAA